jgi:hypothetical protein
MLSNAFISIANTNVWNLLYCPNSITLRCVCSEDSVTRTRIIYTSFIRNAQICRESWAIVSPSINALASWLISRAFTSGAIGYYRGTITAIKGIAITRRYFAFLTMDVWAISRCEACDEWLNTFVSGLAAAGEDSGGFRSWQEINWNLCWNYQPDILISFLF